MIKILYIICVFLAQSIGACELNEQMLFCEENEEQECSEKEDLHKQVALLIESVKKDEKPSNELDKKLAYVYSSYDPTYVEDIPLFALIKEKDKKSLTLLKRLLELGADPNIKGNFEGDKSLLASAIRNGCICSVQLLLTHGANADENSYMFRQLIEMHRDSRTYDSEKECALKQERIRQSAYLLMRHGADINYCNLYSRHVLHMLIDDYDYFLHTKPSSKKQTDALGTMSFLMKLFLENGADPHKKRELRHKERDLSAIEYAKKKGLPEDLSRHFARSFGIYWITRLLSGTKENDALSYGPFPRDIARLIAQHRFNYFVDSFMPLKK